MGLGLCPDRWSFHGHRPVSFCLSAPTHTHTRPCGTPSTTLSSRGIRVLLLLAVSCGRRTFLQVPGSSCLDPNPNLSGISSGFPDSGLREIGLDPNQAGKWLDFHNNKGLVAAPSPTRCAAPVQSCRNDRHSLPELSPDVTDRPHRVTAVTAAHCLPLTKSFSVELTLPGQAGQGQVFSPLDR